ncbi:hypothetical protein F5Y15DRAFT_46744 [Xylariaceae sp. FL0016]|nr:hypothetical protein F5Y15DRAFT_46744 [Xylariaceae sp. FL0016]
MRKSEPEEDEDLGALEDKTESLSLHSKRTERLRKKQTRKAQKNSHGSRDLLGLPYELVLEILSYLRPSDLFQLLQTSKSLRAFILHDEATLSRSISRWRYGCLSKCFRLPVLLSEMDPSLHPFLQTTDRQNLLTIHKKPYQHIAPPDPTEICTCLTCLLRWSALCLVVDFARWQGHLERGQPIPMIQRGEQPEWNQKLIAANANIVRKAFHSPLWHASLLETHLNSTVKAIRRQAANKGNRRRRFRMTQEDVDSETDFFLSRSGPASYDVPYHRDNYYMLEAYVPNRGWSEDIHKWLYLPADQHDRDIDYLRHWTERQRLAAIERAQVAAHYQ